MVVMYRDRTDAGKRLARRLGQFTGDDVVVLGLPRGGVPVAYEVATALGAPLDVIVVRKLGVPFQPELAMGAIGEDGVRVINDEVVKVAGIGADEMAAVEQRERTELARRANRFRRGRPRLDLTGRIALIIDDGVATGSTARAACLVAREHGAGRVVLAVPVAPPDAAARFEDCTDEFIALETPSLFFGVGQFYASFSQTSDEEVVADLERAGEPTGDAAPANPGPRGDVSPRAEEVDVTCGSATLSGYLEIPAEPSGFVLFAHGSGSSRHSARNRHVATILNQAGIGTLLFDLLTPAESADRANVFDVELLAGRLADATRWAEREPEIEGLSIGYFGASTGAAAALWAAAEPGARIAAVVSRGGRPDLAGPRLGSVTAPTRLIVGGHDEQVLELNRQAQRRLRCENDLVVVPGATHLFEEPGTLDRAAGLALDWFQREFVSCGRSR